jgi:hypothetical protein
MKIQLSFGGHWWRNNINMAIRLQFRVWWETRGKCCSRATASADPSGRSHTSSDQTAGVKQCFPKENQKSHLWLTSVLVDRIEFGTPPKKQLENPSKKNSGFTFSGFRFNWVLTDRWLDRPIWLGSTDTGSTGSTDWLALICTVPSSASLYRTIILLVHSTTHGVKAPPLN